MKAFHTDPEFTLNAAALDTARSPGGVCPSKAVERGVDRADCGVCAGPRWRRCLFRLAA